MAVSRDQSQVAGARVTLLAGNAKPGTPGGNVLFICGFLFNVIPLTSAKISFVRGEKPSFWTDISIWANQTYQFTSLIFYPPPSFRSSIHISHSLISSSVFISGQRNFVFIRNSFRVYPAFLCLFANLAHRGHVFIVTRVTEHDFNLQVVSKFLPTGVIARRHH